MVGPVSQTGMDYGCIPALKHNKAEQGFTNLTGSTRFIGKKLPACMGILIMTV